MIIVEQTKHENASIKNIEIVTDETVNSIYKASDVGLLEMMASRLVSLGYDASTMIQNHSFLYAPGIDPMAVVAHVDTVFARKPDRIVSVDGKWYATFDDGNNSFGLGGDDRSGVYIIWRLLDLGHKPHVILLNDEEIGCVGAGEFVKDVQQCTDIKYIVEFDRHGGDQAVYYGCDNKKFEKFITRCGFVSYIGRFSDIGVIAPAFRIAAVNLSIGVHNEHEVFEYVDASEVKSIIEKADKMLWNVPKKPYKYINAKGYVPFLSLYSTWGNNEYF